jgi:selenocysteine lyase/cysteine desulfurase
MSLDLTAHFSRFRMADPDRLHFAAHSHHYWPDVTFEAQQQAWTDAAQFADGKWSMLFDSVVPQAKAHVARQLGLNDPNTIVFANNTHELLVRLLSCLPTNRPPRVLSTDAEFHSFTRQTRRLAEDGLIDLTEIPVEPIASFETRLAEAVARTNPDLVNVSHVFFSSGWRLKTLKGIVDAIPSPETFLVIDGYHAFMALPVDLGPVSDKLFYIAGGYKYAMAGEGACFMHCPPGYGPRPRNTGWYASFGALDKHQSGVAYAEDGSRFMGATFDPTALYRVNAVMTWLDAEGLTPADIHNHAIDLQQRFVGQLASLDNAVLDERRLVVSMAEAHRGNFLTFDSPGAAITQARLSEAGIVTDVRGDRLRVGFGIYHTRDDVDRLLDRLSEPGLKAIRASKPFA